MVQSEIEKSIEELEKQEMDAPNGLASPQVYQKLLALYLCQNDLCNAKYLWKRIPGSVKASTPELGQIWVVGQHLWKRDLPGTYKALSGVNWSSTVADIMKNVQENVRSRAVDLVSQAYSSITLDTLAGMTGLTVDVTAAACVERGWTVELENRIVHPVRPKNESTGHISSEDQLHKLTDFVSYLEN